MLEKYFIIIFWTTFIIVILAIINAVIVHTVNTQLLHIIYLACTGELRHYIEKRKLVIGDLVIIRYRGKYRKAYITGFYNYDSRNQVQLRFENVDMGTGGDSVYFPLSRIIIPEYFSKTAKLFFSKLENEK